MAVLQGYGSELDVYVPILTIVYKHTWQVFPGMGTHVQAVDIRLLSVLPCRLGMRLGYKLV